MRFILQRKGKCRKCFACIRSCPVKALSVHGGQVSVLLERCIDCGACIRACSQGIRIVKGDLDHLDLILKNGKEVLCIVNPAILSFFSDEKARKLISALKRLGISRVECGSFGRALVVKGYRKLLKESGPSPLISTLCPAIINLVEKYYHGLIPHLVPITLPEIAHAREVKLHSPNTICVLVGVCISKKRAVEKRHKDLIELSLTLSEVFEILKRKGMHLDKEPGSEFDRPTIHHYLLGDVSGGLSTLLGLGRDIKKTDTEIARGVPECEAVFSLLRSGGLSFDTRLIDATSCSFGCIAGLGPASAKGLFLRKQRILKLACIQDRAYAIPDVDLREEFEAVYIERRKSPKGEIRAILSSLGKQNVRDELNCGACGYETCREKAKAIYLGMAERSMCLPNLVDRLSGEKYKIIHGILESANEPIFTVDKKLRITMFNKAAEHLTGYASEEVEGRDHREVFRETPGGDILCPVELAVKRKKALSSYEMTITTRSGEKIPVHVSASALRDHEDKTIGGVVILRDVTKLKEIEQLKSDFVSHVSHELRTPLTSIKGATEILLGGTEGDLTESQRRFLEICKGNTERLIRLISDLLDLSKIEAGEFELKLELSSINDLISETIREMKILAEKRDITLVFSDMADIEKFYFDPDKVKQVLINLLSNAIKFSNPESKVCVQTEDSDRFALIKVIDQGIGIHPDDQEKIFEKYYLVNSARRMDASTGIGLSLCKQIVEFHGGSIWVKSKPGKGSLFGFSLLKRTDLSDKDSSFKITP